MFSTLKSVLGIAAAAAVFSAAPAAEAQVVTGTICNTAGHPWGGCIVKLYRQNPPFSGGGRSTQGEQTLVGTAITDAGGRYVFWNPGSATYAVRAQRPGGGAITTVMRTMYAPNVYWIDMAVQ